MLFKVPDFQIGHGQELSSGSLHGQLLIFRRDLKRIARVFTDNVAIEGHLG
jgi:hypothetical protein